MDTDILLYFGEVLEEKKIDYKEYLELYNKGEYQELFIRCINNQLIELVEWLYCNKDVKFYLDTYLSTMNKDLLDELNNEEVNRENKCYRILISDNGEEVYKMLLGYRKYSKLSKDTKGFHYTYNKKYNL